MSQDSLERECRLAAIEYQLCNLIAAIRRLAPAEAVAQAKRDLVNHARSFSIPNVDPVLSDHGAATLQAAIMRLEAMIDEMQKA